MAMYRAGAIRKHASGLSNLRRINTGINHDHLLQVSHLVETARREFALELDRQIASLNESEQIDLPEIEELLAAIATNNQTAVFTKAHGLAIWLMEKHHQIAALLDLPKTTDNELEKLRARLHTYEHAEEVTMFLPLKQDELIVRIRQLPAKYAQLNAQIQQCERRREELGTEYEQLCQRVQQAKLAVEQINARFDTERDARKRIDLARQLEPLVNEHETNQGFIRQLAEDISRADEELDNKRNQIKKLIDEATGLRSDIITLGRAIKVVQGEQTSPSSRFTDNEECRIDDEISMILDTITGVKRPELSAEMLGELEDPPADLHPAAMPDDLVAQLNKVSNWVLFNKSLGTDIGAGTISKMDQEGVKLGDLILAIRQDNFENFLISHNWKSVHEGTKERLIKMISQLGIIDESGNLVPERIAYLWEHHQPRPRVVKEPVDKSSDTKPAARPKKSGKADIVRFSNDANAVDLSQFTQEQIAAVLVLRCWRKVRAETADNPVRRKPFWIIEAAVEMDFVRNNDSAKDRFRQVLKEMQTEQPPLVVELADQKGGFRAGALSLTNYGRQIADAAIMSFMNQHRYDALARIREKHTQVTQNRRNS